MQLSVSNHRSEVIGSLKSYISTKLAKLERLFDRITNMKIILPVEKKRQTSGSTIHISGGEIYAVSEHKNTRT